MFSFRHINSKIAAFDRILSNHTKDIASIDIIDKMDKTTEFRLHIINSHDVYLPITDICYLTINESGAVDIYDPFRSNLSYLDKIYRKNLVDLVAKKIMDVIVE